jgi:hypothetical protein
VIPPKQKPLEYRFVYDSGSDTAALGKNKKNPLEWAIMHLAGTDDATKKTIKIDAAFVSHFEKDHISGMVRLVELTNVQEIVLPHLNKDLLACMLAQFIADGSITVLDQPTLQYLEILKTAVEGGNVLDIPTTRIIPGEPDDADSQVDIPDFDPREPFEISQSMFPGGNWSSGTSRTLTLNNSGKHFNFWELRVWSYRQSNAATKAILMALSLLKDQHGNVALKKTLEGEIDNAEIEWAFTNRKDIQNAYKGALKSAGIPYASNHNTVSLCLYSGPKFRADHVSWRANLGGAMWRCNTPVTAFYSTYATAWLATGDAQLEHQKVWRCFSKHYGNRIGRCRTILMPHHGSSKGKNHNPSLLDGPNRIAVFSAGAFNKYGHPNLEVIESVSDRECYSVTVTELTRPGFFESITYELLQAPKAKRSPSQA